jgi:hypothetical protein
VASRRRTLGAGSREGKGRDAALRTDDLDFVHRPGHLDIVVEWIRARLAGREEIVF